MIITVLDTLTGKEIEITWDVMPIEEFHEEWQGFQTEMADQKRGRCALYWGRDSQISLHPLNSLRQVGLHRAP